jgi:hypothetical protein
MSPAVTTVVCLSSLALSVVALAMSFRRRRDRAALGERLDALAARVGRMEASHSADRAGRGKEAASWGRSAEGRNDIAPPVRADRPIPEPLAGPTLISVPNLAAPAEGGASSEAAVALGRRFATIWERAESGDSAGAIARDTGYPVGQVELILGLKRRIPPPSATPEGPGSRAS